MGVAVAVAVAVGVALGVVEAVGLGQGVGLAGGCTAVAVGAAAAGGGTVGRVVLIWTTAGGNVASAAVGVEPMMLPVTVAGWQAGKRRVRRIRWRIRERCHFIALILTYVGIG